MRFRHLFLALALALPAEAQGRLTDVGLALGDGSDPYAAPVARLVASVVEYSRWPRNRPVVRLCLVGPSDHTGAIGERPVSRGRTLQPVTIASANASAANCDVIYIGRLVREERQRLVASVQGEAVLTIAEDDPACRNQAMICLLFEANELSFRINLDAVSRSQVRIDPRVLRMSVDGGGE